MSPLSRWRAGVNNLVITVDAVDGGGQITIENQFAYGENQAMARGSATSVFSDGVTWTEQDIETQLIAQEEAQRPPEHHDLRLRWPHTPRRSRRHSTLEGGSGADTYVCVNAGDGATWISDQG